MHPTNCLNCNTKLEITHKFCASCGQKTDTHRLRFHDLWHDALHYITHADKGIFHLIRELAIRPGVVAREYLAGKRKKYFKPVSFFLIVAGLLVFVAGFFPIGNAKVMKKLETAVAAEKDPVKKQHLYGVYKRFSNVNHYWTKYANVMPMVAMPLVAFIFWLFYKRAGYSYIEHVVANMYFIPFLMLIYTLLVMPWQSKLSMSSAISWTLLVIFFLLEVVYRTIAYYRFINQKGTWPFLKALAVSVFTVLLWAIGSPLLLQEYIKTGFR